MDKPFVPAVPEVNSMKLRLLSVILACSFSVAAQTPATKTVTVTWQEATPNVTFNVYRWNSGQNGFIKLNAAPVTTLTYNDATAVLGTAYSYKVSAVNSAGESAQSTEADITVSQPITVPAVPTNLKVTVVITN
jgi:fibronectin type 3 domain-containing protein